MSVFAPFFPAYTSGQSEAVTATAGDITGLPTQSKSLCLTNTGTQTVYVRVTDGADTAVATAADYPVPANTQVIISKGDQTRISHVAPGGAGSTLHVIAGEGL